MGEGARDEKKTTPRNGPRPLGLGVVQRLANGEGATKKLRKNGSGSQEKAAEKCRAKAASGRLQDRRPGGGPVPSCDDKAAAPTNGKRRQRGLLAGLPLRRSSRSMQIRNRALGSCAGSEEKKRQSRPKNEAGGREPAHHLPGRFQCLGKLGKKAIETRHANADLEEGESETKNLAKVRRRSQSHLQVSKRV